jgi:serine O-acetyltransferase
MLNDFKQDMSRYHAYGEGTCTILRNPAVWCIFWYRLGRVIYRRDRSRVFSMPFRILHSAGALVLEVLLEMRLNVRAEIGPGLLIAHAGGITLHPEVVIGKNCDLAHRVTMGTRGVGGIGVPIVGDGVFIGTGAVLIGPIIVGDGARIGANSMVNQDVPEYSTVMGVPAQVVSQRQAPVVASVLSTGGVN